MGSWGQVVVPLLGIIKKKSCMNTGDQFGSLLIKMINYPLVNCHITMENHHV
jgi:hypothetical protein